MALFTIVPDKKIVSLLSEIIFLSGTIVNNVNNTLWSIQIIVSQGVRSQINNLNNKSYRRPKWVNIEKIVDKNTENTCKGFYL